MKDNSFKKKIDTHSGEVIQLKKIRKILKKEEMEIKREPTKYSKDAKIIRMYENYMEKSRKNIDRNIKYHFDSLYELNKKL